MFCRKGVMMWPLLLLLHGESLAFPTDKTRVDLTYVIDNTIPQWPELRPFTINVATTTSDLNITMQIEDIDTSTHIGTHIDAPIQFSSTGMSVDQIPVDRLSGPAVVIDVQEQVELDGNYAITVQDFTSWEEQHGQIPDKSFVLIRTGLGRYWNDTRRYMGTDTRDATQMRFPGLSSLAADWLVNERVILGVGFDSMSIDVGTDKAAPAHRILLGANLIGIENLANLHLLPSIGTYLEIAPLKLRGAGGAPIHATGYF